MVRPLPAETHNLYSELLERLLIFSALRSIGRAPGAFTTKTISGETYAYFQYSEPGGRTRQLYLGKQKPALLRLEERFKTQRAEATQEREDFSRLCSQILAGGGWSMGAGPARVLKAFADAGVFEAGAVLVGTHAFGVMGNQLAVRWQGTQVRTQDIDLAAVSLAASAAQSRSDAPKALERLEMGFLPVPALDPRHASASFKVRGQSLRVDFLTPGRPGAPIPLPALSASAQPLPYLDYLIENPEKAAVLDAGGFLVLVPTPARFALHKVIISREREASQESKSLKDLAQAAEIIDHLYGARPGDLKLAMESLVKRKWTDRIADGANRLDRMHPEAARIVRDLIRTSRG